MKVVLIIEDESALREGMKDLLLATWPNITILEAANGALGIELAILEKPSLIIVDGVMPILTGYQLVLLLKAMKTVAHIPLIAVTALRQDNPAVRLMIETCDAYIPKPFETNKFIEVVGQYLE